MATMGVGIVGTGWVSGEHIRAFNNNPNTKVLALCGRTIKGAKSRAVETGIQCAIYDDYTKMLAHEGIDIIAIATPPNCHAEEAIAAARAGKHLMLEKAMANSVEEIRAIRDAVAQAGVKSVVSFTPA